MTARLIKALVIALLVLYFFFLVIARTPAIVGASALSKAVPNLWLGGVTGTLWDGRASGAQIDMGNKAIPLGELTWKLNPLSLLTLSPCIKFSSDYPGQMASGKLCQSITGKTKVKDTSFEGPVALISGLIPDADVSGKASLQVANGEFSGAKIHKLQAQMSWEQASVNIMDKWITFGTFGAKLSEANGGVKAKITDVDGPYKVDLDASWNASKGWGVSGTVVPGPGSSPDVQQGLQVIAEDLGDNKYKLVWP